MAFQPKKSNEMRVTLWTGTMRVNVSGTISGCVIESFNHIVAGNLPTAADQREQVLRILQAQHEKLKEQGL